MPAELVVVPPGGAATIDHPVTRADTVDDLARDVTVMKRRGRPVDLSPL